MSWTEVTPDLLKSPRQHGAVALKGVHALPEPAKVRPVPVQAEGCVMVQLEPQQQAPAGCAHGLGVQEVPLVQVDPAAQQDW